MGKWNSVTKLCEAWARPCCEKATRIVQVKGDNGKWSTLHFREDCYSRFVLDTDGDLDFEGNLSFEAAPLAAGKTMLGSRREMSDSHLHLDWSPLRKRRGRRLDL